LVFLIEMGEKDVHEIVEAVRQSGLTPFFRRRMARLSSVKTTAAWSFLS